MTNPILRDDIQSGLLKKGFKEEEKRGHKQFRLYVDNKKTGISTGISRGSEYKEYARDLLTYMARGLRLDKTSQLVDLIKCPMKYEQYIAHLRSKNLKI